MPPLPNRPAPSKPVGIGAPLGAAEVGIPPRKSLVQSSEWVAGEFKTEFGGETSDEKGQILGPIGLYSETDEETGRVLHRLIHLPSGHPICNFLSREEAVKMGEYLHQNYLTLLRGEDRLKIKEQVVGTWFKEWICHCNVLLKWVDPIEFKKEYDTPTPAPEPINDELPSTPPPIAMKPKGLKLGVQVS